MPHVRTSGTRLSLHCLLLGLLATSCQTPPNFAPARGPSRQLSGSELADRVMARRGELIPATQREDIVLELARAELDSGLDPLLVLAVIEQESRFNPNARGPRGSLGLMQVRPFVGEDIARRHELDWRGPRTLLDPVANVRIGVAYLAEMLEMYGEVDLALTAYNMGPFRLQRMLASGRQPRGTYARKVDAHRSWFQDTYSDRYRAAFQ